MDTNSDENQNDKFIQALLGVKERTIRIVDTVDSSLKTGADTGSGQIQLSALRKAAEEDLPALIGDVRQLPAPQGSRYSRIKASYENALNDFMAGCSHLVKYLETGEASEQLRAGPLIEGSLKAMDVVHKLIEDGN